MAELREYGSATTILFPLVDYGATDFESTPVSFAAGDTQISKDEAAFGNATNSPAHEGNGMYSLALTATEMQAARISITVIDQTATKEWEDQAIIIDTYGNASAQHAVNLNDSVRAGLTALPNAAADAAGGLPISDAGGLDLDAMNTNINDIETDTSDMQPKLGTITDLGSGATLGANLVDIEAQTDDIGAAGAGLTAVPWNAAWDAEVQSECNDALVANGLDHIMAAAVTGTDVTDNSVLAKLVSSSATADWDDFVNTTDSLQAVRDNQISAATVNAQVVDVLKTDTSSELSQQAPPASPTIEEMLLYLYQYFRNKREQTATTISMYNDAGSTVIAKSTISDDTTTFTKGEFVTGP